MPRPNWPRKGERPLLTVVRNVPNTPWKSFMRWLLVGATCAPSFRRRTLDLAEGDESRMNHAGGRFQVMVTL